MIWMIATCLPACYEHRPRGLGRAHVAQELFSRWSFPGNESLAASVNHLLVAGFYINIGYVTLALKYRNV
jgi:hypothetical protein